MMPGALRLVDGLEVGERGLGGLDGGCGVDRFEGSGEAFAVVVGDVAQ